ncbi:MAG: hypothetical protein QF632_00760 [Candidatus Woesearchaeota archaeon]|jgi:hypothetical protein|nr:hypothetical protein [Candidatus Woesearchaeota archaeon]MDP7323271.1 hypothetical protein [Candidatus Woesearchaeota archaeon]
MWKKELLEKQDRKAAEITFDLHVFDRVDYWNIELDKVEETVRTGDLLGAKCEEPNKLCFTKYFGKQNCTYTVITRFHTNFIEVKTVWPKKGR